MPNTTDMFALALDTLALIGFGLAPGADVGGHLADLFLAGALHEDFGRARHFEGNARGRFDDHIVGETELKVEVLMSAAR